MRRHLGECACELIPYDVCSRCPLVSFMLVTYCFLCMNLSVCIMNVSREQTMKNCTHSQSCERGRMVASNKQLLTLRGRANDEHTRNEIFPFGIKAYVHYFVQLLLTCQIGTR